MITIRLIIIIINAHVITAIVTATIIEMACLYKDIRTYSPLYLQLIFSEIISITVGCIILYHIIYHFSFLIHYPVFTIIICMDFIMITHEYANCDPLICAVLI